MVKDWEGATVYYTYDKRGLISRVHSPAGWTYYDCDPRGAMVKKVLPNATVTYHTYDAAGRLRGLLSRGGVDVSRGPSPETLPQDRNLREGRHPLRRRNSKKRRESAMDINFHYAAVKVLACHAGFPPRESELIAYASQYVDDANAHRKMNLNRKPGVAGIRFAHGEFDPICTAHKGGHEWEKQFPSIPFTYDEDEWFDAALARKGGLLDSLCSLAGLVFGVTS